MIFTGSKYPKNILFNFENRSTAFGWTIHAQVNVNARQSVIPFSKLNKIFFGYFDPENIFLDNKND